MPLIEKEKRGETASPRESKARGKHLPKLLFERTITAGRIGLDQWFSGWWWKGAPGRHIFTDVFRASL